MPHRPDCQEPATENGGRPLHQAKGPQAGFNAQPRLSCSEWAFSTDRAKLTWPQPEPVIGRRVKTTTCWPVASSTPPQTAKTSASVMRCCSPIRS